MKFAESALAHKYLDGLKGIEIGGSAHNSFGLDTLNVDFTDSLDTPFKKAEIQMCGECMKVDIIASGDNLPLEDESVDFVISSHVIEHFFDPVLAIKEWLRVVKKGGYVFIIAPLQNALPTETRPCTKVEEIIARHEGKMKREEVNMDEGHQISTVSGLPMGEHGHWSVWNLQDFLPICKHYGWEVVETEDRDSKVGNGFTVILSKV